MSDADNVLEKKHQILLQKYKILRRNHKKLAGIALRLIEALEAFLNEDGKPDITGLLLPCLTMYPGLVEDSTSNADETSIEKSGSSVEPENNLALENKQEEVKEVESSEKEYFKGFWSKPKIPRTPLV